MKNTITRHAKHLVIPALLLCALSSQAQWTPVGSPGFSPGGLSNWQHLELDDNDTLYASFNDEGLATGQGTVMKFDGTNWNVVGTAGFTPGISHHSSFCLAPGGIIYYSFADGNSMSLASVMKYDGSSWTSMGTNISNGECQYSNIKVNSAGVPHLVYIDNGVNNGSLYAKKYDGTAWVDLGMPNQPVILGSASYATAAFDANDILHVACKDGNGQVAVKKFDGANWVNVGAPFLSMPMGAAYDVYLKFNHANEPYITYWNPAPMGPKVSVHKFDGSSWALVGSAGFNTGIAQFTSIDFGPNDTPYVAFTDATIGMKAVVMKFDGTNWVDVGTPGFSASTAAHLSLVVDNFGNPYVGYFDQANGGKTTVMKYNLCTGPLQETIASSNPSFCKGDSTTLTLTGTLNDATEWYWFTGACGGTLVDSGISITVHPLDTTIYYVRGMGGCVSAGPCLSVTVNVADTISKPTITTTGVVLSSSSASGNQWNLSGTPIPGATGTLHTATVTGWYSVTVSNGVCSNTSDSVFINVMNVHELPGLPSVTIYPLPFQETIHLNLGANHNDAARLSCSITDQSGRIVYSQTGLSATNQINLGHLSSGFYFLTLSDGNRKSVHKLVK